MDYTNAMILWDAVCVRVTDVRHERLNGNNMELTEESPFFLFISGKNTRVTIADKPYTLGGDTMFRVARGRRVVIEPSGKAEYRCVAYQTEAPQAVGREMMRLLMEEKALDGTLAARPIHSADVLRIYDSLEAAWSKRSPLNCIRAKEAFYALLCEFYAALAQPERTVPIDAVEWTRRTLQAHFSEDISILRLAKALGVSRSSLHVQFSRRLGVSPQQYLTELRLEAAQRALRETACPVQEIVTACGLKDKNHFYTLYRNRFGMTPGEYRPAVSRALERWQNGRRAEWRAKWHADRELWPHPSLSPLAGEDRLPRLRGRGDLRSAWRRRADRRCRQSRNQPVGLRGGIPRHYLQGNLFTRTAGAQRTLLCGGAGMRRGARRRNSVRLS